LLLSRVVDGVDLDVGFRESVGLVGESGCGKTTLARLVLGLLRPDSGDLLFDGMNLVEAGSDVWKKVRRRMQVIFQDPYASLNPRMTVGASVGEPLLIHGLVRGRADLKSRVTDLLQSVGLGADAFGRYPHEFSGGQRQRICIARALSLGPDFIVADEPVSALDVSVQAQVLNLLADLRSQRGIAFLFISHDLNVVRYFSDRVLVMYLGRIVEEGPTEMVFSSALHPYTKALLSAAPAPDPDDRQRKRILLGGDVPSPLEIPSGCRFHPRCPWRFDPCDTADPRLAAPAAAADQRVACHLHNAPA